MEIRAFSVSEVNGYIKKSLAGDPILAAIAVKGELSNCKLYSSGHMYFSLKDSLSRIRCVMFREAVQNLSFEPTDGMKVLARGSVSVYERDGQYQLYVREMSQDGLGELYEAFEKLKKSLEQRGYFDPAKKKKLPFMPATIGVVTSAKGAAVKDIINTINRRWGKAQIFVYHSLVQGERAPEQICRGIRYFNTVQPVDVLIIGRGGGSIEELWAFNDERVAEAVFESNVPVVSAVGHQTDYTIADFVADLRAATPTAAGELVVPELRQVITRISDARGRMKAAMEKQVRFGVLRLQRVRDSYAFRQPLDRIMQYRQQADDGYEKLIKGFRQQHSNKKQLLQQRFERLCAINPMAVLERGYTVVRDPSTGQLIRSVGQARVGDYLDVMMKDGTLNVKVLDVKGGNA
ncbi:MAG: exodeoxyribonuclease VII large subunit [Clostridiales bacterium]|nr:exodeoxyribonuclease VII large subunit [Clostridiales bacterium]